MKKYTKELIVLILQLFLFYLFPLFVKTFGAIGMVFLMWIFTMILSLVLTVISNNKIKYLYPVVISILFIPSVFIYYNETALIHSIWYLVSSCNGILLGLLINYIKNIILKILNKH